MKNSHFAITMDVPAMAPKPNRAAIRATTKNTIPHDNSPENITLKRRFII